MSDKPLFPTPNFPRWFDIRPYLREPKLAVDDLRQESDLDDPGGV